MSRRILTTLLGLMVVFAVGSEVFAQGGGRGERGGGFGGFGRGGGGPMSVLQRTDVQEELGLTDDQKSEIADLADAERQNRRGGGGFDFGSIREMSEEERREAFAKMRTDREKQQKETRAKIKDILNSKQASRFAQLEFQLALQQSAQNAASVAGVDLSDDDQETLRDKQREVSEKTREAIAKIQRDAQIEILKTVMSESEIEKLMGDTFAFAEQGPRFGRGGAGGGRGDRGGRTRGNTESRRRGRPQAEDADSETTNRRRRR